MKKTVCVILLCLILCGCTQGVPGVTATPGGSTVEITADPSQQASQEVEQSQTPMSETTQEVTVQPTLESTAQPTDAPTQQVTPESATPGNTKDPYYTVLPSATAAPSAIPGQTSTPAVTVKPTATVKPTSTPVPTEKVVMVQDFEKGSVTDCLTSVDWAAEGFAFVANPDLTISNNGFASSKGFNTSLPNISAMAQNYILSGSNVTNAAKDAQRYFRIWVKNNSGGDLHIGIALTDGNNNRACYGVKGALLIDQNGLQWNVNTSDASEMGQGTHSAVIVPNGFEGWLSFESSELIKYWNASLISNVFDVTQILIDVRPQGFTAGKGYVFDDVCFSNRAYGKLSSGATAPDAEIVGPQAGSVDIYSGDSTDLLIGIDQFNRTFDIQVGTKNKQVGMFFWLWNGQHRSLGQQSGNYDASKILLEHGVNTLLKQASSVSPNNQFHFWGEPLWGYYDQSDEWVIRRQMELLTNAGIDFIVFDATNGLTYNGVYTKICKVITQMINDGANPPRVAFYTHSLSIQVINELYVSFYKRNMYPESWYYYEGKPLIIGYTSVEEDKAEAATRGDTSYNPKPLSQEILNFFTFRRPQWPSDSYNAEGFPWIEWKYPQPMYNDKIMNVSVASHPAVPMSFSLTRGAKNWGRGYNVKTGVNESHKSYEGQFFQSQWDTVFQQDPDLVFVDGWNEWIALKSEYLGEYQLCDAVNLEYSRDIEIMKDGYNDAFYIQLIKNIRQYRGKSLNGTVASTRKTIDINGGIEQWANVNSVYTGTTLRTVARNHTSAGDTNVVYKQDAARNNIVKVSITRDMDNFYFLIECSANITGSGANFMNLFIGTGELEAKGWEGYEYVINRNISGSNSDIIKLNSNFSGTKCGTAKVNVTGKYMQIAIPRAAIGMQTSNSLYFKVADNITNPSDIMDYYVSGKSFPLGRLSYRYLG